MEHSCWLMVVYLSIYSKKCLSRLGQVALAERRPNSTRDTSRGCFLGTRIKAFDSLVLLDKLYDPVQLPTTGVTSPQVRERISRTPKTEVNTVMWPRWDGHPSYLRAAMRLLTKTAHYWQTT
jgi:hypothetical protein